MAGKKTATTKTTARRKPVTKKATSTPIRAKEQKPAVSLGAWITLLLLAAIVAFAAYLNKDKQAEAEATPTGEAIEYLFPPADGTVSSIEVKPAEGDTVRIARNADNVWAMELPLETEADPGYSEAAASQVSALTVTNSLEGNPSDFGLEEPAYVITVEFAGGKTHTLEIGDSTPTNSGYYVRLDGKKILITDLSGIDSLLQLAMFPPYLNTPTPTATVTQTSTPSPTATPAPPTAETSATPSP
ncbi:MAG: DUF4340 domain-containing protein [Chloroflexi bacterium]|nr:DUF4340 domain-containing protein [Chloroflexota bacterium]